MSGWTSGFIREASKFVGASLIGECWLWFTHRLFHAVPWLLRLHRLPSQLPRTRPTNGTVLSLVGDGPDEHTDAPPRSVGTADALADVLLVGRGRLSDADV